MQKTCTKCLKCLEATPDFFNRNPTHYLGLYSKCKRCVSEYNKNKKYTERKIRTPEQTKLSSDRRTIHNKIGVPMIIALHRFTNGKKRIKKIRNWEDIVGYSVEDLKRHLESKFKEGMNWGNHGMWEIDHIKPKSAFSILENDIKKCWALENLQPLWKLENSLKGSKYTE